MATEELRLEASVVDRFSSPLQRLRTQLQSIKPPPSLGAAQRNFENFEAAISKSATAIRDGLTNAMSGLGAQSAMAAVSIAGLAAAVSRFAGNTGELKALSRETGISIEAFRNLKAVAGQFQASPEGIEKGLRQFGSHLYDFRRGVGQTYAEVLKVYPDMAAKLKQASPDQALDIVLDTFAKEKDRQQVARMSEALFSTRDFERLTGQTKERLRDALLEAQKRLGTISPEDKKRAQAFEEAVGKLQQSFSGLGKTIGTEVAPHLTKVIEGFDTFIQKNPGISTLAMSITALGVAMRALDILGLTKLLRLLGVAVPAGAGGAVAGAAAAGAAAIAAGKGLALAMGPEAKAKAAERRRQVVKEMGVMDSIIDGKISRGDEKGAAETRAKKEKLEAELRDLNQSIDGAGPPSAAEKNGASIGDAVRRRFNPGGRENAATPAPANPSSAPESARDATPGTYRPPYPLKPEDLSAAVTNTVAGEASWRRPGAVDAVISNMLNRVGSRGWGPSGSLMEVARAPGQYEGYRQAGVAEAEYIRSRIRAIAEGRVPDSTEGSNAYRAAWYSGPWMRRHGVNGRNVGGNVFAYEPWAANGPYAPYREPKAAGGAFNAARDAGNFGANQQGGPTGRAELEVTINGLPHGWKSRADGGDLFRGVKVGRGRSMMMAPDEP